MNRKLIRGAALFLVLMLLVIRNNVEFPCFKALTITLYAMKVSSTDVKAYKAIVIILLVVIGSPVIKAYFGKRMAQLKSNRQRVSTKGAE